jgi:hypothetical protein
MSIIDNTYFINDLAIPNAIASPTIGDNTPDNIDYIDDCIEYVEKNLLINALGLTIYNELQTALADLPSADQKWKDLVNGLEYDGKIWEGLRSPKSLLCYAVYYTFLDWNTTFWTTVGVQRPQAENSTTITPEFKLATAFQTFSGKYQGGYCFEPYRAYIDGVKFTDYLGSHDEVIISLFQYLKDKKADFTWEERYFKGYRQKNSFGL